MTKKQHAIAISLALLMAIMFVVLAIYSGRAGGGWVEKMADGTEIHFHSKSVMELFKESGPIGLLLLVFGNLIIIYGVMAILKIRKNNTAIHKIGDELDTLIKNAHYDQALSLCRSNPGVLTDIIGDGLAKRSEGVEEVSRTIEESTNKAALKLSRTPTRFLFAGVITLLFGLLGTITGIISSFQVIATLKSPTPKDLATGVYEALVNTTMGLFLAMIAIFFCFYIKGKANEYILELESRIERIAGRLK